MILVSKRVMQSLYLPRYATPVLDVIKRFVEEF